MADVTDYTELITSEHADKAKFMQMVTYMAQVFTDIQNTTISIPSLFDLDSAVGVQLDVIGLWVGLSRYVGAPISGIYFSFNTADVGWNQGNWKGPFDPTEGLVQLDDETYRLMLKSKIGANSWDGTLEQYQEIMQLIFAGTGSYAFGVDYQDMSMEIVVAGDIPSALFQALLTRGYFPMKPVTVRIRGYTISTTPGAPVFAFNAAPGSPYVGGWNVGGWGRYLT